jgi:iron(III) transport system ATP-binding protein
VGDGAGDDVPGITIAGVSRRFGNVTAVDSVDLEIRNGEFLTLLGPSGCGKTTTLRMVAGLEPNDGGRISIGERVVSDAKAGVFVAPDHRNIGMVFQSYAIWPHMTVFENVAYPLRIRRKSAAEVRERVGRVLQLVDLGGYAERPAPLLSGGQQQRVAIARALVFEPEVLLLDEPLSNLDAKLRTQTGDEFRALQRRLGITTLYVTHDQEEAMALSDRIVVMHAGKILQAGAPEEIYRRPRRREVAAFFGSPNLLEATAVRSEADADGTYRITVRGERWDGICRAAEAFPAGSSVLVMIRPEDVRLSEPGAVEAQGAWRGTWHGTVMDTIFRGPRRSITIDVEGRPFHVESPSLQTVKRGQKLSVAPVDGQAWAFRA